jgi:gamma-glutamyl hydrolase
MKHALLFIFLKKYRKDQITIHIISTLEMKELLLLCLVVVSISIPSQAPVIGIYTQTNFADSPKDPSNTYISASYVKYMQASGAQVVPIFAFTKDRSYFDKILSQINGIVFTGGDEEININNLWTSNADYIFKYAINQTKSGNPFAIWGICLGWELLAYLSSGYDSKALTPVRG